MKRGSIVITLAMLFSSSFLSAGDKPIKIGKRPGEVRGRWLEVKSLETLKAAETVCIGEVSSVIERKEGKETPIDEEILNGKIEEHLMDDLGRAGLFDRVLDEPPQGGSAGCDVRLDADLLVEPGSRAARYVVGFGAGKSKSILEIHLRDHESGERVGLYHGYGTGTGMGLKVAGGGARKMTQDDIQENSKKFVELLHEVMSKK